MEIRPAMKVLHGNPAHEYYILERKGDEVLLMRTSSDIYNQDSWVQKYEDGRDKPYYPYWAHIREIYLSGEFCLDKQLSDML